MFGRNHFISWMNRVARPSRELAWSSLWSTQNPQTSSDSKMLDSKDFFLFSGFNRRLQMTENRSRCTVCCYFHSVHVDQLFSHTSGFYMEAPPMSTGQPGRLCFFLQLGFCWRWKFPALDDLVQWPHSVLALGKTTMQPPNYYAFFAVVSKGLQRDTDGRWFKSEGETMCQVTPATSSLVGSSGIGINFTPNTPPEVEVIHFILSLFISFWDLRGRRVLVVGEDGCFFSPGSVILSQRAEDPAGTAILQ